MADQVSEPSNQRPSAVPVEVDHSGGSSVVSDANGAADQVAATNADLPTDGDERPPLAPDEYADAMIDICNRVVESSAQFTADLADIWWRNLPVNRASGLDMAGTMKMMVARLSKLGPEGDPLEQVLMGSTAYMQGVQDQMRSQATDFERLRTEYLEYRRKYEAGELPEQQEGYVPESAPAAASTSVDPAIQDDSANRDEIMPQDDSVGPEESA